MHRAENVDREDRLRQLVDALERLHVVYGHPVVCSLHPHTRSKIESFGIDIERAGLRFVEPLGFFDFVRLEQESFCLLSDSGTVQEEACIFGKPNVTIRDVTERPETIESGSNALSGTDPEMILSQVALVTGQAARWEQPVEYLAKNVAKTVVRIVLGHRLLDAAEAEWVGA
jgi:UDP-N-acetylglucosamine 2-epimerase (non-hydrolysing)